MKVLEIVGPFVFAAVVFGSTGIIAWEFAQGISAGMSEVSEALQLVQRTSH